MMKSNLKIRLLRHFTGLDQQQIAAKLLISVADYSRIETGLIKADDAIFKNLLSVFDFDPEQFSSWPNLKSEDMIKITLLNYQHHHNTLELSLAH